jgi:hypothetical protein
MKMRLGVGMSRALGGAAMVASGVLFLAGPASAFDVACGMVCADNSPGSTCMSSCSSGNSGAGGGGGNAAPRYGAIALSPRTLKYGYAFRFASRKQAEEAALTFCYANKGNPRDCKVLVWYRNTCASLAIKPPSTEGKLDGAWGAQWASSRDAARKKALAACQSQSATGCRTELTSCAS